MKKQKWKATKTLRRENILREIFQDRVNVLVGLTKLEVISQFKGVSINTVLRWNKNKIELTWEEIVRVKRILRKEMIMAIVSKQMPRGSNLNDTISGLKNRILDKTSYVFFRCSSMEDVWSEKDKMDKIAKGVFKAAEQTGEIVERDIEQKPMLLEINQPIRH